VVRSGNKKAVATALQAAGFLDHDPGRLTRTKDIDGRRNATFYTIRGEILEGCCG
jgi:hypothetical protein